MRTKDNTVECEFHHILTAFLFAADIAYREWSSELTITSGSESGTKHSYTSLHYATPCQAADVRSWSISPAPGGRVTPMMQTARLKKVAKEFCDKIGIPHDWIEVILEPDHIHIEYQPKRLEGV